MTSEMTRKHRFRCSVNVHVSEAIEIFNSSFYSDSNKKRNPMKGIWRESLYLIKILWCLLPLLCNRRIKNCVMQLLLGNGSVNTFPRQRIRAQQ
jgi:hypothetical protein